MQSAQFDTPVGISSKTSLSYFTYVKNRNHVPAHLLAIWISQPGLV